MKSLTLKATKSFGIGSMCHTFNFKESGNRRCMAIYAPNGSCKSSLRKSLERWNQGKAPEDVFYPEHNNEASFEVITQPSNAIPEGNVFCFRSMPEIEQLRYFEDSLLASPKLKTLYSEYITEHREQTSSLLATLHDEIIGGKGEPTKDGMADYVRSVAGKKNLYDALEDLLSRASGFVTPAFMHAKKQDSLLKKGFEDKLRKGATKASVEKYARMRNAILETSGILHSGFDVNAANNLIVALEKAHFFDAGHALVLRDAKTGADYSVIESADALRESIDEEFGEVEKDPSVKKAYSEMDKTLGSAQGMDELRAALCDDFEFASAATDIDGMKLDYLIYAVEECRQLVESYLEGREKYEDKMHELIKQVRAEETGWDSAIDLFNRRFHMPFTPEVGNRESAIMGVAEPVIEFKYGDKSVAINTLKENLSDGERKALYMLSIIFEVEKAKKASGPRLLVFDDVVDSFDYVNKYAFIEYLREFSNIPDVYVLLLTHNYDFFRTVTSRLEGFDRCNCVAAEKSRDREIGFEQVGFLNKSPFQEWKAHIDENVYRIAAVPMVRELVAIRKGTENQDYDLLSEALHNRGSGAITFNDLHTCFREHWNCNDLEGDGRPVSKVIISTCGVIAKQGGRLALHEKIALSLGIRIIVEDQIVKQYEIAGQSSPDCSKMGKLAGRCKADFVDFYRDHASLIEQAVLITPENIHINSFMYEPLVDIGSQRFIDLYLKCEEWATEEKQNIK